MASWTPEQNKHFEQVLAIFDKDTPDRWQNVSRAVGKSVEDVKKQYMLLEDDIRHIESGPFSYARSSFGPRRHARDEEQRLRHLRL